MSATHNLRNLIIHICIWISLIAAVIMLLLINMEWKYAVIRAAVIIIGLALGHYTNTILFNKYLSVKKYSSYLLYISIFLVSVSSLRYVVELHVVPPQTQPFYIAGEAVRPVFILFSNIVILFMSTVLLYALYFSSREKEMLQLINTGKEAKLQYLHAQINPHFLFNALNNIYSLSLTGSPRTPEMLLTLTDILRYSVYQNERRKVAVVEEADQIEFLIRLFNLKNDDAYRINFIRENVQGYIEPMILVPLAENCLKHCDFDMNDNAHATMKLEVDKNTIRFTTENTFSKGAMLDKVGGVGRANIIERLKLVYADRHEMKTTEGPDIYKVELSIQWNS